MGNSNTLTAKHGHKVFDEDKSAVKSLLNILKDDESTDMSGIIVGIAFLDRQLASDAISKVGEDDGSKVTNELEKKNDDFSQGDLPLEHSFLYL